MKTNAELKIGGMTCGHCKSAVEEALKDVNGVTEVVVDLENAKALVSGDVDVQVLIAAVVEEGYEASAIQRTV